MLSIIMIAIVWALISISYLLAEDKKKSFAQCEMELLAKKNYAEKKRIAMRVANEAVKTAILNGMESGKAYTITDIIKSVPECADFTNQRVSALMRQIVDSGAVMRTEDKRKAYFTKVG